MNGTPTSLPNGREFAPELLDCDESSAGVSPQPDVVVSGERVRWLAWASTTDVVPSTLR